MSRIDAEQSLGSLVRKYRIEHGFKTQTGFAQAAGFSRNVLSQIETNRYRPGRSIRSRLESALGVIPESYFNARNVEEQPYTLRSDRLVILYEFSTVPGNAGSDMMSLKITEKYDLKVPFSQDIALSSSLPFVTNQVVPFFTSVSIRTSKSGEEQHTKYFKPDEIAQSLIGSNFEHTLHTEGITELDLEFVKEAKVPKRWHDYFYSKTNTSSMIVVGIYDQPLNLAVFESQSFDRKPASGLVEVVKSKNISIWQSSGVRGLLPMSISWSPIDEIPSVGFNGS